MQSTNPPLLTILGPTASGKTALAIALAKQHAAAVISADSRQVFAGLNIGTAKPRDAWQDEAHPELRPDAVDTIPHYLLNVADPRAAMTLAGWQQSALNVISHLYKSHQEPIIVGGTMLYIDSVVFNFDIPPVAPQPELRRELEERTTDELYEELLRKDPAARAFIEPSNRRRIIRALEVITVTGQLFSAQRQARPSPYRFSLHGLFPGWEKLEEAITVRTNEMLRDGLLEETKKLQEQYGSDLPLLTTMNYRQAAAVLRGEISKEAAHAEIVRVTMRYAHRQMSWWKKRQDITWHDSVTAALKEIVTPD